MKEKMDKSKSQRKEEREKVLLLEKTIQELKDDLLLAHVESDAKDELLAKQAKVAKEAVAGWQKAESEMLALKQQLKNLTQQKSQIEQNFAKLREEISTETKTNISTQQEKIKSLEEKLIEANDKVSILTIENKNLYTILDTKETIIKEMNESSDKASLTEMKVRLDATEKENSNLKYELHMAQKELEIRNKERDYNIKTAEAAYKQQMESLKKVSKLETECNKLRMMLRKRLPGPGAIAKMRNEINGTETRKKLSSPLVEKLHVIEEENRVLKETLARKNEDTMSCVTESWATTFISELEHLKEEKLEGPNSDFGFEEDQFQNYPGWLKDIVRVIIKKHYVIQMSVNKIIEEVLVALKSTGFYREGEKDTEKCIVPLKTTEYSDKASAVPESSDICVADENSPKETYDSHLKNEDVTNKPSEEVESQGSNNPDLEENKVTHGANNGIEKQCDNEVNREIGGRNDNFKQEEGNHERKLLKGADELEINTLKDVKNGFGFEFESETKLESNEKNEEEQHECESDIMESSKKLAECQEEMQNISKQLQALSEQKNPNISDEKDNSIPTPKSDQRSCSLYQILTEDGVQKENSDEKGKLEALAAEQENGEELLIKVPENDVAIQLAPKRQKEGKGLLSRIFFARKRREIKPEKET